MLATEEDLPAQQTIIRNDRPIDRVAWHFASRTVRLIPCDIAPPVSGTEAT